MSRLPGVNARLAAAWRTLRSAYELIPVENRPELDTDAIHQLEQDVDAACLGGDREAAIRAIEAWENAMLGLFENAARAAEEAAA